MGLRQQAAADLQAILEDTSGFGWPITVIDQSGASAALMGRSTDIGHTLDPQTGQSVASRQASVAIRIQSLADAGLTGIPRGVSDETTRPWIVSFADTNGVVFTFKVTSAMPDRALGIVVCMLEQYRVEPGLLQARVGSGGLQTNVDSGNQQVSK